MMRGREIKGKKRCKGLVIKYRGSGWAGKSNY
jgi:hypothetical protein